MRVLGALFLLLVVGIGLIGFSITVPEYHDDELARYLLNASPHVSDSLSADEARDARKEFNDLWFAEMRAARTKKWFLLDAGIGFVLTAVTFLLLFSYLGTGVRRKDLSRSKPECDHDGSDRQIHDSSKAITLVGKIVRIYSMETLTNSQTPRARWRFIAYGTIVHFGVMASWWLSIHIEFFRHYYPWWADSIGIPLWGVESFARTSWPILVITGIVLLIPARLPTTLWYWNKDRPFWSWFWTLVHVVPGAALVFLMAWSFTNAMVWGIPFMIFGLYLIESSRSAGLTPREPRGKTGIFSRLGLKRAP